MENILEAALYGAIGGAFGALIGQIIAFAIPGAKQNSFLKRAPIIIGVVLSIQFADDILKPHVGKFFPETNSESRDIDDAMGKIKAQSPGLAAIFRRELNSETAFRDLLSESIRTSVSDEDLGSGLITNSKRLRLTGLRQGNFY